MLCNLQIITSFDREKIAYTRSWRARWNDNVLHHNWGARWPPYFGDSDRNIICHTYKETNEQEVASGANWKIYWTRHVSVSVFRSIPHN